MSSLALTSALSLITIAALFGVDKTRIERKETVLDRIIAVNSVVNVSSNVMSLRKQVRYTSGSPPRSYLSYASSRLVPGLHAVCASTLASLFKRVISLFKYSISLISEIIYIVLYDYR